MARRVNLKFLVILTVVVVSVGVAGLLVKLFLIRESPEKYVAYGNQMMADNKYEEAAKNFAHAVALDPKNPSLWVAYGDALNQLSPNDTEYMVRARKAWENALAVDASNKPALDRMMAFWSDVANLDSSQPSVFEALHDTATRLYAADNKNSAAEVAIITSVVRPWLGGVEKDQKYIEDQVAKLLELMQKYPENPDLPMFAAQAKLRLAERKRQQDRPKDAEVLMNEASRIVDDAIARTPTPAMYFSAAQVYQAQEQLDPRNPTVWRDKKKAVYAKARELAQPNDPLYVPIHINAARAVADDRGQAIQILRALLEKMPEDQQVRLALADALAMERGNRKEALEILERPFASTGLKGPKAFMVRELQIRTLVVLTNLRIEAFGAANPDERKTMLASIEDGLSKIEAKDGVGPRSLRLRGKLLRLQGQTIDAIQTLEKARTLADQRGSGALGEDRIERWEVVDMLAKAYLDVNQTGQAKNLLTDLVNRFPGYDPARRLLTQLMIKEGAFDDAKVHVEYFKRKDPNDAEVAKWEIQIMDPKLASRQPDKEKERNQIRANYAKLPEKAKPEMMEKVEVAMVVDQQEDAIRLLNKLQQEHPGDFDVARLAVRVYRNRGELDAAKAAVASAIKVNPNDEKLQLLNRQVQDLTPEGLLKVREEELKKNPDEFARSLGLADIARRRNQPDDALKLLHNAQRLKPDNLDVTTLIFNHYLWQKQWDKAEMLLEPLSRANQDQTNGLLFRYRLAMARQDYQAALTYGRDLTKRMAEFGQSWLAYAQALQATSQYEEALKNYAAALEKQGDSPDALRGSIECYYALNRPNEARNKIRDARRVMPSNAYFQELEISHELTYGNPELAVGPREDLAKRNPDRAANVMALGQAYLATARSFAGKPDKAAAMATNFAKARETFKNGLTRWPDEIAFYAYYAETAARSGEVGDSEQVLKQVASRDVWKDKPEPQMLLGEFYAVTRRYPEAEAMFRSVLQKLPTNTDVQVKLANLLVSQNKTADAIKVLEANADDSKVARRKVEILLAAARLDEADAALEQILARTPGNLEVLQMAASIAITRQKFDVAQQRLNRALEIDRENPTTHYFVGLMIMSQPKGDVAVAMQHLAKGKDSPTVGIDARFALADCLRRRSDPDAAIRELESALQAQPHNKRVRLALLDAYAALQPPRWVDAQRVITAAKELPGYKPDNELLQREASMYAQRNEPKLAVERINEALAVAPNDQALVRTALTLFVKARQYGEVNTRVEQLVAKDQTLWWAYQARAVAKRNQGRKDESIKDFEAALTAAIAARDEQAAEEVVRTMGDTIGPDEAKIRIASLAEKEDKWKIMSARLDQTKGDTAAAVKTLESVLARDEQLLPQDKENAYRFGGTLYLLVGNAEKSKQCYEKLLQLAPDDMTALNNLACLLGEIIQPPRPSDGLAYSQRAFDLMQRGGRRDPLVLDTHGWLLTLAGRTDQGIDVLRSANELKRLPDTHYHLGEAYIRKQFAEEAMRELEMALDLVKRAEQEKQQVDPQLRGKIEAAMSRAGVMQRQKNPADKGGTAANAPTAPNVP